MESRRTIKAPRLALPMSTIRNKMHLIGCYDLSKTTGGDIPLPCVQIGGVRGVATYRVSIEDLIFQGCHSTVEAESMDRETFWPLRINQVRYDSICVLRPGTHASFSIRIRLKQPCTSLQWGNLLVLVFYIS